ncbi:hypothetical protein [Limnofasciculus baicalensis]|uniref:Uncharacterized protein n=1 Tax=Limnofasciculus baicalensis BBK-W-15 TaxID=2699891 RepID=A0AAE3KMG6_9CYAN|nr:hypothetical protein [Limnofasciculus baicalensis]MCP2729465.1 hypothetical protein [Limnofasciculus baicalensis BBK-W-15]
MSNDEWIFFHPVVNSESVNEIQKKLSKVVDISREDNLLLIKQSGWVAVPVESGDHFSGDDRDKLLDCVLEYGYREIIAVPLEKLNDFPAAFIIPSTAESVEEFNRKCGGFWFAIFAGKPDWVILCTKLDYLVITGKPSFVRQFLGSEIDEAFSLFYKFASDCTYESVTWQNRLFFLLEQLKTEYPSAEADRAIDLFPPNDLG